MPYDSHLLGVTMVIMSKKVCSSLVKSLLTLSFILSGEAFSSEVVKDFDSLVPALEESYELIGYGRILEVRPEYHNGKGPVRFPENSVIGISGHLKNGDFFQWRIDFDANHDDLHINVRVGDQPYALRINGFKSGWGMGASEDVDSETYRSIIRGLTGQDFTVRGERSYHKISESIPAKNFLDYIFEMASLRDAS